jgi:hypothetical protein
MDEIIGLTEYSKRFRRQLTGLSGVLLLFLSFSIGFYFSGKSAPVPAIDLVSEPSEEAAPPLQADGCSSVNEAHTRRWPRLPIKIAIDGAVLAQAVPAITRAAARWNNLFPGIQLIKVGIAEDMTAATLNGKSRIHMIIKNWQFQENYLATTYWDSKDGMMSEADVLINASAFNFSFSNKPKENQYDFESLLIHEFGHLLGLCHSPGTVMNKNLSPGKIKRVISSDLRSTLACLYSSYRPALKRACRGGQ